MGTASQPAEKKAPKAPRCTRPGSPHSYPKLRLSPAQVAAELTAAGFEPDPPSAAGRLSLLVAARKASLPCGMSD
jgi:hypothetical protein